MTIESTTISSEKPARNEGSAIALWERTRRLGVEINTETGLPQALLSRAGERRYPLALTATLITEGREIDRDPFGLAYADTIDLADFTMIPESIQQEFAGYDELFTVGATTEGWEVTWEYRFRASTPRLEVEVRIAPAAGRERATLRNLHLQMDVALDRLSDWLVEAPGSVVRHGIAADAADPAIQFSEPTFNGSGILLLHNPDEREAVLVWPFSRTERARNQVQTVDGALRVTVETQLAGRISDGERLRWGALEFDVFDATWDELRPSIHSWFDALGVSRPVDTADWIPGSTIFEVQIGTSVFWKGYEYSPYPTMRDLYNDLGRIAGLGFDCIQIMPRQPFPSYNVYDYADITTSYGDEDDLRVVVEAAHALGMKVILDILMHGVIDADIIHRAADRVRHGPYFARLDEGTEVEWDPEFKGYQGQDYLVAWSRHILDFEEHWAAGSPGEHPLVAEHPEWFVRRSDGEIIGVYTKAFDVANVMWQEYFTESALQLVRRLGIDGFRFDAPSYNDVPNWSPATEKRASASQLGAVEHFMRLRTALKALDPEAMLYTEPSGTLFRQTMDITYNYDEHWLIHAVLRPESALAQNPHSIRHARDLAAWLRDKEAALPNGAMTARHIDSHDTFWWPLPGFKWRREQYGVPATRALLATFSLVGGVYMTFVGGEQGVEEDIRRMNRLRDELPEIKIGHADYDAIRSGDEHIFAVVRRYEGQVSLVLVNLSDNPVESTIELDPSVLPKGVGAFHVADRWNDLQVRDGEGYVWSPERLSHFSATFAPYQASVFTIRPALGKA